MNIWNEHSNICTLKVNIWTLSLVKDLSGLTCTAKPLSNSQGDKDYKKWINQGFMYVYMHQWLWGGEWWWWGKQGGLGGKIAVQITEIEHGYVKTS